MSVHDGHRERLKKRFLEQGLDGFDDHTILELLLFYALPRQDTNPIAHELLNHFGTLDAVFDASFEELVTVKGIGEGAAALIKLIPETARRCEIVKSRPETIISSSDKAGAHLVPLYMNEHDEVVYIMCLDGKGKLLCCKELFRGVPNSTEISLRKIAELALSKNASAIIISHNHPSGIAVPSIEDEQTTRLLKDTLLRIGVELKDHIVVAGDDFVSMADSNLL